VSPDDILASGTFTNVISLFSRSYEHISTFKSSKVYGITQIIWSYDGKYMYIIPRHSEDIEVWDIRSTGEMVSVLSGREAVTNQRLWTDLSADGAWLVSGGTDGNVRGWKTDRLEPIVEPSIEFKAHDGEILCRRILMCRFGKFRSSSSVVAYAGYLFRESFFRY
jgi:WD40 repeat protein